MERVNGKIIVSVVILMAAGVYRIKLAKPSSSTNVTRVIVGGYILAILASVIELVAGPVAPVAGMLLALAVGTALYAVLPDLLSRINTRKA
jgi:hypothetical protein